MLHDKNKQDVLDYFLQLAGLNITTANIRGPFSFMFDTQLDENWRILYQALALCIVIVLVLVLDKHGGFTHLRSHRVNTPDLIVAVGDPQDANRLCSLAHKRGLVPDQPITQDEGQGGESAHVTVEIDPTVPARGEKVILTTPEGVFGGVVLENGKCNEKLKREWIARWENKPCRILHLKLGDSVAITVPERVAIYGAILSYRFPRFIRKAFKRRTSCTDTVATYFTVSSHERNRVLAIIPVAHAAFEKDIVRFLPKANESKKTA